MTVTVCSLQAASAPRRVSAKTSPQELFKTEKTTTHLLKEQNQVPNSAGEGAPEIAAPKFSAPVTSAAKATPEIVGIYQSNGMSTISTTKLDGVSQITNWNYIQSGMDANAGVYINGKFYAVLEYTMIGYCFLYNYDSSLSWANMGQAMIPVAIHPTALAYDAVTTSTYGCFSDNGSYLLATLDVNSGVKTNIASLTKKFTAMAVDKSGVLYAIGEDNALYTIDKASAAETKVGDTGLTISGANSIFFDNDGTTLYLLANNAVYKVDTATGATSLSTTFTGTGAWNSASVLPAAEILTPSWIDDITINFPKGALSGEVSMRMPQKSTSGATLTSDLTYHLWIDEVEKTGTAGPGQTVVVPVTLEKGMHTFRAYAEYEGTAGMEGSQTKFIGHDTPVTPANIAFFENGTVVNLTWDAVTTGVNDGYIDVDAVRYNVVRNPGGVSIASDLATNSCTDATIDALNYYTYVVTATDGVATSEPGTSDVYFPGSNLGFKPPYSHDFSTGMNLYKVIDANKDGVTWGYSDGFTWFITDAETDNDDWIISPPITLTAGKRYPVAFDLLASANWEYQVVEILYGKGSTPEELTNKILPAYPYQVSADIDSYVTPEADGQYYFAVRVLTKKTAGAVGITNFAIGQGYDEKAPANVDNLTVTPAAMGQKSATISFTCPDKNYGGTNLTELTRVLVKNETTGMVVKEITDITPGFAVSDIADQNPAEGTNTYSVTCYNSYGEGNPAKASCWIGVDIPAKPENISWRQDGTTVHITWEAPTIGIHGGYIGSGALTYRVAFADENLTPVGETNELTLDVVPEFATRQDVLLFAVSAVNEKGEGEKGLSNESAAGKPYETPFYESFENVQLHSSPWLVKPIDGYNSINIVTNVAGLVDMNGNAVTAVDYDYGMLVYTPLAAGKTRLELPIIDISGLQKPVIKMWCFFLDGKTTVTIQGNNNSGNEWTEIAEFTKQPSANGWNLVALPLEKFKGEGRLQLGILCSTPERATYVLLDKISVEEGFDNDMVLADVTFPNRLYAGKDFSTTFKVNNGGLLASPAYEVQLFIDGKLANSVPCPSLPSGGVAEVPVSAHLSSNATSARLQAQVLCANDGDVTNNALAANVYVVRSALPAPEALTNISKDNNEVALSWTAPECRYEAPVTDSFEDLEAGSVGGIDVSLDGSGNVQVNNTTGALGKYKLIDNDRMVTSTTAPTMNIPNAGRGMVCQVIDVAKFGLRGSSAIWESHSGDKLLAFWQSKRYDPAQGVDNYDDPNDDWMILPKLSENNKMISFWAKSLTNKYGLESFDIMVSVESDNIEDFELFAHASDVPAGYTTSNEYGYTLYEFDLPEETQYVAIRYNAAGTLALLIDDLTYAPEGSFAEVDLLGYNLYRNDEKVNAEPLTATEIKDMPLKAGDYYYNVTALYNEGESPYSNTVTVTYSGVSGIDAVEASDSCTISVENRTVVVKSAEVVTAYVYSPDGRLMRQTEVNGVARITLSSGIYVVKAGEATRMVVVK